MKRLVPYVAVVAMAAALAGCNRGPGANSAYNNSGTSATPGSTSTTVTTTSSSPSTDASSPGSSTTTAAAPSTDTGTGNVVADTVTTGKVKAAIATDPILKDADIMVKTDAGVVVLTGTAKSRDQVAMATNIAQRQEGVSRVDNQVTVK